MIGDQLRGAGYQVGGEELISSALNGLSADYNPVQVHLIQYEEWYPTRGIICVNDV